ncbi:MAG: hypothetical protein N4A47_02520 [Clostridia bacterium]|jgi:predicted transcriptional regulator|nr:hypothetical protein [Clostridia bacterium]
MTSYNELLILIYLKEYEDEYLLTEIKELCGFTNVQMKTTINNLIDRELLTNEFGRLLLTEQGNSLLKEKGLNKVSLNELFKDIVTLKFTGKPFSFEDIYIPKQFKV